MPPIQVAIVEDDALTRASWRSWLKPSSEFLCTAEFESAEQALLAWHSKLAEIALVDLKLPNMGGVECIHRLRDRFPRVEILVVSVINDSRTIFEALLAGASGYLLKSATRSELIDAIRDLRSGGAPMTPSIGRKVLQSIHVVGDQQRRNSGLNLLTECETAVVRLFTLGMTNKEIAMRLNVSEHAIKARCRSIYRKLEVSNRAQASVLYGTSRMLLRSESSQDKLPER